MREPRVGTGPVASGPVHGIEVKRHFDHEELAAVTELLSAATDADAHPALGEHAWLDLAQGGRDGFAGLVAWEPGHPHPVGYAQLTLGQAHDHSGDEVSGLDLQVRAAHNWALELVIDPHHRTPRNTIGIDLVRSAIDVIAEQGGGHLHLWVSQPAPYHYRLAAEVNLQPGRSLYQMRRPLPMEVHSEIRTRAFKVGQDEEAWLDVNNRAFDWHPEQGDWDEATLSARQAQPWFDPAGFLLYEQNGKLAGFCWTKVHEGTELGEIYVIAVAPDFAGQGLGRQLTLAGLDYLAGRGIKEAMLYVDAANPKAVGLYVSLGFVVNHIDRAFTGDIGPANS